jgi:acetyl esterase/lipase
MQPVELIISSDCTSRRQSVYQPMKTVACIFSILGSLLIAAAQPNAPIPLWPEGAPGALGKQDKDTPTLSPFWPTAEQATGAAVIICPGGGYWLLSSYEGQDYAHWLNQYGIACFVLKYRLGSDGYHHPAMLQDVASAMRLVRFKANEWKLDPDRIGIMGSSAGGHLASTLLTHFDSGNSNAVDAIERASSRPNLGILCYPVITMGPFTDNGSKQNLLGNNPSPALIRELSTELQVRPDMPPCFVWATFEDKLVPMENSLMFVEALRKANVPFDFHIYQKGQHGMGLGQSALDSARHHPWTDDCLHWLHVQGFIKGKSPRATEGRGRSSQPDE